MLADVVDVITKVPKMVYGSMVVLLRKAVFW
jgi:hypothetical protein